MSAVEVASLLSAGVPAGRALRDAPSQLVEKLQFALAAGAPLVPLLKQLDRIDQNNRLAAFELEQALAVPKATRRLLIWLPAGSLVFAQTLGLSSLESLGNPLVLACALLASLLLFLGARISSRQIAQLAQRLDVEPLQQFMIAVSAGMGLAQIKGEFPGLLASPQIQHLMNIGLETGARLLPLAQAEIDQAIAVSLAGQIQAAKRLSVRILIPLGTTSLPAFMLLTVPPILVGSLR